MTTSSPQPRLPASQLSPASSSTARPPPGLPRRTALCRVPVLVDGSQGAVDVRALGCDFYAVTGHKLYGPSASGAIYIRRDRAAEMRPFRGGGDMIRDVTREEVTYAGPPLRFEAGTPAIVPQIGFGAALQYLMDLGMDAVAARERRLRDHARQRLGAIGGLTLHGTGNSKGPLLAFGHAARRPQAIAARLDEAGIAVRGGAFCSRPLLRVLGMPGLCRASFGLYNTLDEVDCGALEDLA